MVRAALVLLLLMLMPPVAVAQAEKRIALLIGNQTYNPKVGPLKNPHYDIGLVGRALRSLRFDVREVKDGDYRAIDAAIKRHVAMVRREGAGAVSMIYYAGHGAAEPDTKINYLIPVDVANADDENLWINSLNLNQIVESLREQAPAATHYVVFDACRNELNLMRKGQKALADKGFVPLAFTPGVMVAYSTAPGRTATDTGSGGGSYARILAEELVKPGVEAITMFRRVALRVNREIGQDPWMSASTLPEVYFAGAPMASASGAPPTSEAAEAWAAAKETTSIATLEVFLARFKDTYYADLARLRIEELKKKVALAVPTAPPPAAKEAQPAAAITPARCDGIEITMGQNERRCFKPGAGKTEHFKDCPTCPEMVVMPAGSFTLGSPANEPQGDGNEAQVRVSIAAPFVVGRFAVTFDEWDACVTDGGCNGYKPADQWGRGKYPVINVNWDDAKAYALWVSRKTGKSYRLLSEAEREYVTRAGTTTPFWWGSSITPKQANYDGSADPYKGGGSTGEYRQRTVLVDNFEPNPWGLYQVHGNVWEWTEDCWNDSNTGNPGDGSARANGDCSRRVVRGGSWVSGPRYLRSANRYGGFADNRARYRGFRLARTLAP